MGRERGPWISYTDYRRKWEECANKGGVAKGEQTMRGSVRKWRGGWQYRVRSQTAARSRAGFRLQVRRRKRLTRYWAGWAKADSWNRTESRLLSTWRTCGCGGQGDGRPSQYANYEIILERHIKPHLGDVRLPEAGGTADHRHVSRAGEDRPPLQHRR